MFAGVAFLTLRALRAGLALFTLWAGLPAFSLFTRRCIQQVDINTDRHLTGNGRFHLDSGGIRRDRERGGTGAEVAPQHHSPATAQLVEVLTAGRTGRHQLPRGTGQHRQADAAHLHKAGQLGIHSIRRGNAAQEPGLYTLYCRYVFTHGIFVFSGIGSGALTPRCH